MNEVKYGKHCVITKNQIRHFWQNKIIEGQSQSGRILHLGLDIDNNKVI